MKCRISRRAHAVLKKISARIAEDNPDAADRGVEKIYDEIGLLAKVPGIGHRRTDVLDDRYLFRAAGNYVIAYRATISELIIVRVLHGARDFRKLFGQKKRPD